MFHVACHYLDHEFSFAAGKGSALVVDIGHTEASVTPVVDGFVLRKGMCSLQLSLHGFFTWNSVHRSRTLKPSYARASSHKASSNIPCLRSSSHSTTSSSAYSEQAGARSPSASVDACSSTESRDVDSRCWSSSTLYPPRKPRKKNNRNVEGLV